MRRFKNLVIGGIENKIFTISIDNASNNVGTPKTQVGLVFLNNVSNFFESNCGINIDLNPSTIVECIQTDKPNP